MQILLSRAQAGPGRAVKKFLMTTYKLFSQPLYTAAEAHVVPDVGPEPYGV